MKGFKDSTRVKYEGGGSVEGTSARPRTASGREMNMRDMERANRDTGGMAAAEVRAAGEAIGRGNRAPRERMPRDLAEGAPMKPRSVTVERTTVSEKPDTALSRKLSTLPSQKGEMGRGRGKGRFSDVPLIGGALDAIGLAKGGLAAMPKRGKKC